MKIFKKFYSLILVSFILMIGTITYAATSPSLGAAETFGVLAGTYTNTVVGTTINGDVGYTTAPAVFPIISNNTHVANALYNQAGIDQGNALIALNGQTCTFTFAAGAIDLATDTTHGSIGVYSSGVYCVNGAASIGTAGITLSGNGIFIFKINGAFNSAANSFVSIHNGASECDIWWAPESATTLGANTKFKGTIIAANSTAITVGANTIREGKALAFGSTVTTDKNIISVPLCTIIPSSPSSGGGSLTKDNCPEGDYSASYYDGTCGIAPTSGMVKPIDTTKPIETITGTITSVITPNDGKTNDSEINENIFPKLPNTGIAPSNNIFLIIFTTFAAIAGIFFIYNIAKKIDRLIVTYFYKIFLMKKFSKKISFFIIISELTICSFMLFYIFNDFKISFDLPIKVQSAFIQLTGKVEIVNTDKVMQGLPSRLKIPSIGVDSSVEHLGLTNDGAMKVPTELANVGWFNLGTIPGKKGTAVVGGHHGLKNKVGVFYNLRKLHKGDFIYIENDKGDKITFVVKSIHVYDFETNSKNIFTSTSGSHLNLITCVGNRDKTRKVYPNRLVIFTDIVE